MTSTHVIEMPTLSLGLWSTLEKTHWVSGSVELCMDMPSYNQLFEFDMGPAGAHCKFETPLWSGIVEGLDAIWSRVRQHKWVLAPQPTIKVNYKAPRLHIIVTGFRSNPLPVASGTLRNNRKNPEEYPKEYRFLVRCASYSQEFHGLSACMAEYSCLLRQYAKGCGLTLPWLFLEDSIDKGSCVQNAIPLCQKEQDELVQKLRRSFQGICAYLDLGACRFPARYLSLLSPAVKDIPWISDYTFPLPSKQFQFICASLPREAKGWRGNYWNIYKKEPPRPPPVSIPSFITTQSPTQKEARAGIWLMLSSELPKGTPNHLLHTKSPHRQAARTGGEHDLPNINIVISSFGIAPKSTTNVGTVDQVEYRQDTTIGH
ncbi:hypothetical protein DFH06DRAFT_1312187 [Mycena polygramma]|nr:hypothetical protein DFH06DRAFT_1312187 [Mycena polygramma]